MTLQTILGLFRNKPSVLVTEHSDNTVLYRDDTVMVTPSWLTVNYSRYAIRTIGQLDFKQIKPQAGSAVVSFFIGIALIAYSLYQLNASSASAIVLWGILFVSIIWTIIVGWLAFLIRPYFRVTVLLLDGSKLIIKRRHYKNARELLDGVTHAMDWHRQDDIAIDATRASHVRRRIASAAGTSDLGVDHASNDEYVAAINPNATSKKRQQLGKILPLVTRLFGDRDR